MIPPPSQPPGRLRELWDFVRWNRAWWMVPILIVLLGVGALVTLGSGVLGPFFYPLF